MLAEWLNRTPIIGMLHAPPLPGSPHYGGSFTAVREHVLRDAETLVAGGTDGLMLENFGDAPFYPGRVPAETIASLTCLAAEVRRRLDVPLGINVLRNDGQAALAIAVAVGAAFIRVNILCSARVTDQGVISGIAHELLRDRARLGAAHVSILADVDVKHSAPLAPRPLAEEVHDLIERGGADALIVTGGATGSSADPETLSLVKRAAGAVPVFVGSGVTPETVDRYLPPADGFIVGTGLKVDGKAANPVDEARVRALAEAVKRLSQTGVESPK